MILKLKICWFSVDDDLYENASALPDEADDHKAATWETTDTGTTKTCWSPNNSHACFVHDAKLLADKNGT